VRSCPTVFDFTLSNWSQRNGGKNGGKIWRENMAGKYGGKIWRENMAGKYGGKIWQRLQTCIGQSDRQYFSVQKMLGKNKSMGKI
jgi:hypothetical protein